MKYLNCSFEIENDLAEHNIRTTLESMNAKYVKTLPNTDHLKEDKYFIKLKKDVKNAKDNLYNYINKNRKQ